jgi:hypothetical protein
MARRKRTSPMEDLFDMFFELTGMFWQVGAVVTVVLFAGGLYAFMVAINYQPPTGNLTVLVNEFSWLRYSIPVSLFFLSGIFGIKTYSAYQRQNYY